VAFRKSLGDGGFIEDRNVALLYRWADYYDFTRLRGLASDLVERKVSVIVVGGPAPARAATAASSTIPIVLAIGFDRSPSA
jgi:putative tryptophan/tyrosine transport system substrate-binding protein